MVPGEVNPLRPGLAGQRGGCPQPRRGGVLRPVASFVQVTAGPPAAGHVTPRRPSRSA